VIELAMALVCADISARKANVAQPLAATKTGTAYSATIDLLPIQVEQPNRCSRQRLGNVLVRSMQGIFSRR
jgi:hypothetical protein